MSTDASSQEALAEVRVQLSSPFRDGWHEAVDSLNFIEQRLAAMENNVRAAEWAMTKHAEWYRTSEARLAAMTEALREILRHTGASNVWTEGDGCQARRDGDEHDNCRPVIFDIARAALASGEAPPQDVGTSTPPGAAASR
jgi:hypothetical protein